MNSTLRPISPLIIVVTLFSSSAIAFNLDPVTYLKLSKSCQSWVMQKAKNGDVKGMSFSGLVIPMDLQRAVGPNIAVMDYYCPALASLVRYENRGDKELPDTHREKLFNEIFRGIDHQLQHGKWTKPYLWFQAEVLSNRGRVLRLMDKQEKAIASYKQAVEAYPPYLPAHWALAEIYEDQSDYDTAIESLNAAMKETSNARYLQTLSDKRDQLLEIAGGNPTEVSTQTDD